MLKNLLTRVIAPTYTVVVDRPIHLDANISDAAVEDAMQAHVVNVGSLLRHVGYHPRGLTVTLKREHVSARAVVRIKNDEAAAGLLALIRDNLCEQATTRIFLGVSAHELHDYPLETVGA